MQHHHHSTATSQFTCPMHPEIVQDTPGKCPKCGMDLIPRESKSAAEPNHSDHFTSDAKEQHTTNTIHDKHQDLSIHDPHAGHDMHNKHEGHHTGDFLKRFWICLIVTIPILLLSHMIQEWLDIHISFPGDEIVLLVLSTFIFFYGGMPFLKGMISELKHNAMGMMTLVAIAISVAYIYSVAVVFGLEGMDFFWELATLIDIMLLGHWLEMRSEMAASKALQSMVELLPATSHVEINGSIVDISLKDLVTNDIVLIKPGEKIAADGTVVDGNSSVNESMLTGESIPVKKEKDSKVLAGSINENGALKIRVTGAGQESYLHKVINLVQSAQATKSTTQNLADKVAKWLTIISILVGVITFLYWYFTNGNIAFSLERLVTVIVTSCPPALGGAIPLGAANSTTSAAVNGLLIRNRTAFENARKLT